MSDKLCPCSSGKNFSECCGEIISGKRKASTPEELMKARYSAYVVTDVDFIVNSTHKDQRATNDRDEIRRWSERADWKGIEIITTDKGGKDDEVGFVEFIARYADQGVDLEHHEISEFRKDNGEWFFYDGKIVPDKPYKRESPKIGRNDPCPCGSGKKYKKCCGK